MSATYLEQVLDGHALWTDIEDFVSRWHEGGGFDEQLHAYLGLPWDEYSLWVERSETLRAIIASHERDEPLQALLERTDEQAVAARDLNPRGRPGGS